MADNTQLNTGAGGDTIRTIDRSVDTSPVPAKTQVVAFDIGGESGENLLGNNILPPTGVSAFLPTRNLPPQRWRTNFSAAYASSADSNYFSSISGGAGQSLNQAAGALNVVAGTTAYAETIIRSVASFQDAIVLKYSLKASQRIANNNFYVELVDVIGDGLAYTINGATSVTVTFPSMTMPDGSTLSAANIGQSMYLGALTTASTPGGRYAISAVSGAVVTFTVSGFPASGSGTCSVFGWNYHQIVYTGTTVTNANWDTQSNGYNYGFTTCNINTTASPGHIAIAAAEDDFASYQDIITTSNPGAPQIRATRIQNVPKYSITLVLQIRCLNGTSSPASSTTFTLNFIGVDMITPTNVTLGNIKPQALQGAAQVSVLALPSVVPVWLSIPSAVADIASAAITSTATSSAITPSVGNSYIAEIDVTAVSGTNPTLDIILVESDDSGTNYYPVFQFPRITASGNYRTPPLTLTGNRLEYIQVVGGTSPSFTRAVNRLQMNNSTVSALNQVIANAPSLTATGVISFGATGNAYTQLISTRCRNAQLTINSTTAFTTAASVQMQGSDDSGVSWYNIGTALSTGLTTGAVSLTVNNINAALLRANVTTAGAGGVAGAVVLKAF